MEFISISWTGQASIRCLVGQRYWFTFNNKSYNQYYLRDDFALGEWYTELNSMDWYLFDRHL